MTHNLYKAQLGVSFVYLTRILIKVTNTPVILNSNILLIWIWKGFLILILLACWSYVVGSSSFCFDWMFVDGHGPYCCFYGLKSHRWSNVEEPALHIRFSILVDLKAPSPIHRPWWCVEMSRHPIFDNRKVQCLVDFEKYVLVGTPPQAREACHEVKPFYCSCFYV
jgi:hypothetical protein